MSGLSLLEQKKEDECSERGALKQVAANTAIYRPPCIGERMDKDRGVTGSTALKRRSGGVLAGG